MSEAMPPTGNSECVGLIGPMTLAWTNTFKSGMDQLAPCLVIVWHSEWMYPHHGLWQKLYERLRHVGKDGTRILVVIFGDTPHDLDEEDLGNPLLVLLRALAEDADSNRAGGCGWAAISDVVRFRSESVKWKLHPDSALLRFCRVCAAISEGPSGAEVKSDLGPLSLTQFFQFLRDPVGFRANILHGAEKPDQERRRLCELKWLATHAHIPQCQATEHGTTLKILVVENEPKGLCAKNLEAAKRCRQRPTLATMASSPLRYISNAEFYVIRTGFASLKAASYMGVQARKCVPDSWESLPFWDEVGQLTDIPWAEIDLVLQDVMLGRDAGCDSGLALAPLYFEACPQALVFLLTSLDIESLVVSGDVNWRYVDAVIPKDGLENLWSEYRRCFLERFGRMFWPDWSSAKMEQRMLLRGLFGSLRKWQIEPDILWHGQNLPEMIDHANRHITALWRMTNEFVGTLLENGAANKGVFSLRRRIALAVAVWMHDVGHRGDEYVAGAMDVRASHAGISERLLLRNPDAYGLGWLAEAHTLPHEPCQGTERGRDTRLECRNALKCHAGNEPLCLLREVGLLCRHHQSNAPLDRQSLIRMAARGKSPSVYSLIPDASADPTTPPINTEEFLRIMTNESLPAPSPRGTRLRALEDFVVLNPTAFMYIAGLLRMLDALQLHRSRVGSVASINSFIEFLNTRFLWCATERKRLEHTLRAATPGTRAFHRATGDLDALGEYELLLTVQHVHYWRQSAVHDVRVLWRWNLKGAAGIDIAYTLNERALAGLAVIKSKLPTVDRTGRPLSLANVLDPAPITSNSGTETSEMISEISTWIRNIVTDVILPEHKSQYGDGTKADARGYLGVLADNVRFRVVVTGTDQTSFDREKPYVIHPNK